MRKNIIIVLSLLFTLFSFSPSLFELWHRNEVLPDREFVLEHNYMFDFNFYLSRIREGQEGRWTVTEKYFNQPHQSSFLQILYVYLGKIGGLMHLTPPIVYHSARVLLGFLLLYYIGKYALSLLPGWWGVVSFLFAVTAGSWPIMMKVMGSWRSGTYMGWWSVTDSLQRITFIPHILFGQLFILLFLWRYSVSFGHHWKREWFMWAFVGFIVGIVFPPTIIVVYVALAMLTIIEGITIPGGQGTSLRVQHWFFEYLVPRGIFFVASFVSLIYLQHEFTVMPWSALALFDIEHRMPLPYMEWFLALGPVLPLGLLGALIALIRREKSLLPLVVWIAAIFALCRIFENVPTQSPLRFTEAMITVPLGICAGYACYFVWSFKLPRLPMLLRSLKIGIGMVVVGILGLGFFIMYSSFRWQTDQGRWKREGTWQVPIGAQVAYPLKEFMSGVRFFTNTVSKDAVVLSYVTAGNFIPAYAGQYVYIGHANTPDEDKKEQTVASFFAGIMKPDQVKAFLSKERISYIFYGPQEQEIAKGIDLVSRYPFLQRVYYNSRVSIYKISQ